MIAQGVTNAAAIPPPGQGFRLPSTNTNSVTPEAIPNPLLPAVESRMLMRPEHWNEIVRDLPETHLAKHLLFKDIAIRRSELLKILSKKRENRKEPLWTITGFGVSGLVIYGDALLGNPLGFFPSALIAALGLSTAFSTLIKKAR